VDFCHRPKRKINSVALVRERTIPTERLPLVGEASAYFCGWRVPRGQRDIPTAVFSPFYTGFTSPKIKITIKSQRIGNLICFRLQVTGGRHLLCWVS
jgi:hypothetical protein